MFSGVTLTFSGNSYGAISFLYWGGKQILIYISQCKIQSSAGHHIAQCKHCFELHILLLSAVSQVNGLLPVSLHFKTCSHWHRIWAKISPWFLICDLPQGPYKAGCSIHSALTRYNSNILAWHFLQVLLYATRGQCLGSYIQLVEGAKGCDFMGGHWKLGMGRAESIPGILHSVIGSA